MMEQKHPPPQPGSRERKKKRLESYNSLIPRKGMNVMAKGDPTRPHF
jgi:hypothetical protein